MTTYSTAKGYVQSMLTLMGSELRFQVNDDTTFFPAFHMLAGFAAELYMKSFLLSCGIQEGEFLKNGKGHNLKYWRDVCEEHGLKLSELNFIVEALSDSHKGNAFRYLKSHHEFNVYPLSMFFHSFSKIDAAVDNFVEASVSYGKVPGSGWDCSSLHDWRF